MMKRAIATVMSMALCVALVGCGGSTSEGNSATSTSSKKTSDASATGKLSKDEVKIEDIDWEITSQISDYGNRRIVVEYTNNSSYPIFGFDMTFTLKDGLTDEDMALFDDLKEEYDYTDDELAKLTMRSDNETYTRPGESAKAAEITLGNYWRFPTSLDQVNNMEPDIATIGYLTDDGVLHVEYYDFKGSSYTLSEKTINNTQQTPTHFGDVLPEISAPIIISSNDDEDLYMARAYGLSSAEYDAYVQACKDKGFTVDSTESDAFYNASDSDSHNLTLTYSSDDGVMAIDISNE